MSKSHHDRYVKGHLVPKNRVVERKGAIVGVRPIRLAFIINENINKFQLYKYLEYNSTIWGGYYNLLIPTDGQCLRDDWRESLLSHDPDIVIFCGEVMDQLVADVENHVYPYYVWKWRDDIFNQRELSSNLFGNMSIKYPLLHMYHTNRPISKSNLRIPNLPSDYLYTEYAAAQFGSFSEDYNKFSTDALQAQMIEPYSNSFRDYLNLLQELEDRLTPIKITKYNLSTFVEAPDTGFTIVLSDDNFVPNFCLFWNLRMQPFLFNNKTFILPFSVFNNKDNIKVLAEWCGKLVHGSDYIVIASATISKQRLLRFREKLMSYLSEEIKHVDVWFSNFITGRIRVYEIESREELTIEDGQFRLKTPRPTFADEVRDGGWSVDIRFDQEGRTANGFLPPKFRGLNFLLSGKPKDLMIRVNRGFAARLANDQVSRRVTRRQEFVFGSLPAALEIFDTLLNSKGYTVVTTDKCRYAQGVINIIGGLEQLKVWRDGKVRYLFYEMRGGAAYTPKEMISLLKLGSDKYEQAHSMFTDFARKKILLRGYKIHCPTCDLTRWYSLSDISESMLCAGCLTPFQPPIEAPFHYKLNELVARAVEQGSLSVLLTVLVLQELARTSFLFIPGMEVHKSVKTDVDIVASCDGNLILVECKDLREGTSLQTVKAVSTQLNDLVKVALDVGAKIVLLSMLIHEIPQELQKQVDKLNNQHTGIVAVHLFTANELERGYKAKPLGEFLSPDDPNKETAASLWDFLPPRTFKPSGWIKEPGTRTSSF